jgi:hypothetical protein
MNKTYDITYSTEVKNKDMTWAKPFCNGTIKAFFVPSVRYGREIVELIQRMDLEYETVTIDRCWDLNRWGFGDFYDKRGGIWDFDIMYQNLENVLTSSEEFDVLVIPGINGWGHFTEKTRKAILRRVEQGSGLVLIHPFTGDGQNAEELDQLSPLLSLYEEGFNDGGYPDIKLEQLGKGNWTSSSHYITDGIPFSLFPYEEMGYYPYRAAGEVIIRSESGMPIAAVKEYGKGRIAAFGYYSRDILPQHNAFTGMDDTFNPIVETWKGAQHSCNFDYLEYFYGLIGRSIIWSARKEPDTILDAPILEGDRIIVPFKNLGNEAAELTCHIKNEYDEVVVKNQAIGTGLMMPDWIKSGGRYRAELSLTRESKVVDWYTLPFEYEYKSIIESIVIDRNDIKPGEDINGILYASGKSGIIEIQAVDGFGRVLWTESHDISEAPIAFRFQPQDILSLQMRFVALMKTEDGHMIQKVKSESVVVTPEKRTIDDFEVFMSPQNRGQGDLLPYINMLFPKMGVTGLFIGDNKVVAMSGGKGLGVYWYHRAPYTERKEQYLRTKDKKYLIRKPCLNDTAFWEENDTNIIKNVSNNKKYGPIAYFAQDEGSLTCYTDELDLCFCDHCMTEMRSWLKTQYCDLDHLNQTWGTEFNSWDDVVPYTREQARKLGEYASWGDHRLFMERTYTNSYKHFRDAIKQADPRGIVRMSGCQASTAYSGNDYYLLHQYISYFEAYPVGNQYEYHRSFARPDTIIGGWFGYGASGMSVQNRIWHAVYHGLTLISIFWEYQSLNPDFTFSSSARDMAKAFLEIKREGIGKLLLHNADRDDLGIAIHYSMPSIHGINIKGDKARFENNRQGWLDVLEDMGYQYRFVSSQQIEAGYLTEQKYKVLIMPYSIALSEKETEEIKQFTRQGGTVIGDLQTGIMDQHCRLYDSGKLDELFGIERLTTDAEPFYINGGFMTNKDFPYFNHYLEHIPGQEDIGPGVVMAEIGTRTTSGKAAYVDDFARRVASVVVNEYGNGKGIYLNFSLDQYSTQRTKDNGGKGTRQLLREIFGLTSVKKYAALQDANGIEIAKGFETVYYTSGSAKYVCLLREMDEQAEINYDGLILDNKKAGSQEAMEVNIDFDGSYHIYDVRKKAYIGFDNKARAFVKEGDTAIFSLLPCTVDGIAVNMPDRVTHGSSLSVDIEVKSGKSENEYSNVLAVSLYDPDGEYNWLCSENISISRNRYTKIFHIPYNEKRGMWKMQVKDVATGICTEKQFEVK